MHRAMSMAVCVGLCLACERTARAVGSVGNEGVEQRSFTIVYEAATKEIPVDSEQVRMWIPVPVDTPEQTITNVRFVLSADRERVERSLEDIGSLTRVGQTDVTCTLAPIANGIGRSLCVETSGEDIGVRMLFDCTRLETRGGEKASAHELETLRRGDSFVPLTGRVAAVARELPGGKTDHETGRLLYEHTLERMRYAKPEGQPWGRGDSEWACNSRFGNCTDFHSYFMGLARTKGLAARFEMGFSVPGGDERVTPIGGYHCWAYFYDSQSGWVPVDISEADKHPDKAAYFFGNLDADRVTMTGGRDLKLTPAPAQGSLNFFIYPHVEVDGNDVSQTHVIKSFKRIAR